MYNRQCKLLLVNVSLRVMILSSVVGYYYYYYYYLQEPDNLSNKPTMHRITDMFIDPTQTPWCEFMLQRSLLLYLHAEYLTQKSASTLNALPPPETDAITPDFW
jgi:hypothetical protein